MEFTQKLVYDMITNSVIDSSEGIDWVKGILEIKVDVGYTGYCLYFIKKDNTEESVRLIKREKLNEAIHWLNDFLAKMGNSRWNEAEFVLHREGKFEVNFKFNKEIQDKVDAINNSLK